MTPSRYKHLTQHRMKYPKEGKKKGPKSKQGRIFAYIQQKVIHKSREMKEKYPLDLSNVRKVSKRAAGGGN